MSKERMRISAQLLGLGTTSKRWSTGQSSQLPPELQLHMICSLGLSCGVAHSLAELLRSHLESWVPVPFDNSRG